jgi:hypothetical protein
MAAADPELVKAAAWSLRAASFGCAMKRPLRSISDSVQPTGSGRRDSSFEK